MTMDCPAPVDSGENEAVATAEAKKIQILHLEDDPRDRELVRALLTKAGLGCRFGYAQTWAEFMDALSAETWDSSWPIMPCPPLMAVPRWTLPGK
jgi:hypothetical protein